jgi:hypothetical protein
MKNKLDADLKNEIRSELAKMVRIDQKMRSIGFEDEENWRKVKVIDLQNTKKLKEIIAKIGWPTISKVGKTASHNSWLIAQHADRDKDFQKYCLALMKKEPAKEIFLDDMAYLEDRLRVSDGKYQLYGTQFYINKKGDYGPRPIKDKRKLNKRRKEVGLPPMESYYQMMMKKYGKR